MPASIANKRGLLTDYSSNIAIPNRAPKTNDEGSSHRVDIAGALGVDGSSNRNDPATGFGQQPGETTSTWGKAGSHPSDSHKSGEGRDDNESEDSKEA
jgi:hypothetical protein